VSSMAPGGKVIRGPAAEREMARMEREAKGSDKSHGDTRSER
jgi:hypothetical protein